jgi:hypothetical protein
MIDLGSANETVLFMVIRNMCISLIVVISAVPAGRSMIIGVVASGVEAGVLANAITGVWLLR